MSDLAQIQADQLDESGHHLQLNLLYFNLLILLLSSGASYFLARMTLRPIEEMVEAQNRFTADASHELRTPLTAMRTEIEVSLRDSKLNLSESRELLKSNLEEISKLETLSASLLKLAQYREDNQIVGEELVLPDIATEAYQRIEKLAEAKKIKFDNDFSDARVMGDRQSLIELFVIILDNAIKYSPKESKISINITQANNTSVIKIADKGMGIKASDLPYIFNRFYRADLSRNKEKIEGYGLGLSIAKRIVDLHGGTIEATSISGKGTEFVIKFPKIA
jgi:signal transduction histidine kinase